MILVISNMLMVFTPNARSSFFICQNLALVARVLEIVFFYIGPNSFPCCCRSGASHHVAGFLDKDNLFREELGH